MKVLDLFSGIGGFSLGLERAGMQTIAFCEIEPYCRAVLRKHWPNVPIYDDVRELNGNTIGPVDLVCGGFPCQPFSSASHGVRKGQNDNRYLWPEMRRVISEAQPSWVLCENVTHIDGLALESVVSNLEAEHYEVQTLEIPACAVGHYHRRSRYWILGYADRNGKPTCGLNDETSGLSRMGEIAEWQDYNASMALGDGLPRELAGLGNAVVPQVVEQIGRAIIVASA